jgi:hypothetical protein
MTKILRFLLILYTLFPFYGKFKAMAQKHEVRAVWIATIGGDRLATDTHGGSTAA